MIIYIFSGITYDYLSQKVEKNEGEVPMYYIEGDHEAIIDPAVFEMVQQEFERRKSGGSRYSGINEFLSKIKCGQCGSWFGAKVWHSTKRKIQESNLQVQSQVQSLIEDGSDENDICVCLAGIHFRDLTGNAELTDEQVKTIIAMLDEIYDKGVFKELKSELRGMLSNSKRQ